MRLAKLVETIRDTDPGLLDGIPDERAAALIETVFRHINHTLAVTESGQVNYGGLGRFIVKQVTREVEGKSVVRSVIRFIRIRPGARRARAGRSGSRG
jgi:hypothetical protein